MKIIGPIQHVETIANGTGIRELTGLRARHGDGDGNWKKKKGVAMIGLNDGTQALARSALVRSPWYRQGQNEGETMAMKFVVCVNKEGFDDLSGEDVTIGHVYEALGDPDRHGMIRIIDQSGEDYLYPANGFEAVTLSDSAEHRLHDALARMSA